ncbi:MAG: hypothetical protein E7260_11175 [Lachnospiraceae bacterium]|nr:hypothetical protein [Lachnospiraceae bacterium]
MGYNELILHYVNNYSAKIFMTRLTSDKHDFYLMYVYEFDKELEYFADTFLKYLPFYAGNDDYFYYLEQAIKRNKDVDLDELLVRRSKSLRANSKTIPNRTIATDGIYGELFLDFYLRIVNKRKPILTYVNKRSFDSNYESTGPDNMLYYIDSERQINICICEAKFVAGAANAKNKLIGDIVGDGSTVGHVTKQYLNDYFQFVVEKNKNIEDEDKEIFKPFLFALNEEMDSGKDFLSVLIDRNICVNFIFFAIFDSTKKEPNKFDEYYEEIYGACKLNVEALGIKNYKVEIVFIPTTNASMKIKREMEKAYE